MSMVAMAGSVSGATVRTQKRVWGLCTGCSVGLAAGRGTAASGLGTARGQSRSATPWPPRPRPQVSQGAEGWPGGPQGCGYHRWELQHLRVSPGGNLQWELEHLGGVPQICDTGGSRSTLAGTCVVLGTR